MRAHTHTHIHHFYQHPPGKCTLVCHNWAFKSKYTPTLPAGLFVRPAWYLECRRRVMKVADTVILHYFFMSVNPAVCCHRKVPSSIESDSPRKGFSPPFITIIVSTIIHEWRGCMWLCVGVWVSEWVPTCLCSCLCVFLCAHVCEQPCTVRACESQSDLLCVISEDRIL